MSRDQHLHLHSLEAIRHQVCCVTSSHVDSNAKCKVTPALVAFKGLLPTFNTSGCIPRRRQGIASAAVGDGIYKQQEDSLGS